MNSMLDTLDKPSICAYSLKFEERSEEMKIFEKHTSQNQQREKPPNNQVF